DVPKLLHQVRGDLDWIVMKCLEKDRTRRYDTATGLAMDLQRHLNNEPVLARPPSNAYKLQKAWRRNKLVFSAGALVVSALVAGLGLAAGGWHQASRQRDQAVQARKGEETQRKLAQAKESEAQQERRNAEKNLYLADMVLVQTAWEQNNVTRMRQLLRDTA